MSCYVKTKIEAFSRAGLIGFVNNRGQFLVPPLFLNIQTIDDFGYPLMKATFQDGTCCYVEEYENINGLVTIRSLTNTSDENTVRYLTKNGLIIEYMKKMTYGYTEFGMDIDGIRKYGLFDESHNIILDPVFDSAMTFPSNYAIEFDINIENMKYQLTNDKYEIIFLKSQDNYYNIQEDIRELSATHIILYHNAGNDSLVMLNLDSDYNIIKHANNAWFLKNGKFGLVSESGNVIIRPQFDYIYPKPNLTALVVKNKQCALYDISGRELMPFTSGRISRDWDNRLGREKTPEQLKKEAAREADFETTMRLHHIREMNSRDK